MTLTGLSRRKIAALKAARTISTVPVGRHVFFHWPNIQKALAGTIAPKAK